LTEPTFFDGALEHLRAVRARVDLPLLRKDFVIDAYQLLEARASGADAVLLIVAILEQPLLEELISAAAALDLGSLVEVHDREDLTRAVDAGASLIGVNNRDLRTQQVSLETSLDLVRRLPSAVTAVSESGLRNAADLGRLRDAGFHAFLVGEHLMSATDPGDALAALLAGSGERDNHPGTVSEGHWLEMGTPGHER
jgi:indole-3-glycerol phosphate synthase